MKKRRCPWTKDKDFYNHYHDHEWGVPQTDDKVLFEFLILEGAQAGLNWDIILQKRAGYRAAFHNFDVHKVARLTDSDIESLRQNPAIIRNHLKIKAARTNARMFIDIQKEYGSFARYLWAYVDFKPQQNHLTQNTPVPATSSISEALSKDLKKRGMTFVGPTIMYAYMQAVGLVNDHYDDCFRDKECAALAKRFSLKE